MSVVEWTQEQMFEVPRRYRPPKAPDKWPRWRKYTGRRTSCDDCILSIASGVRQFISEPARYVRQDAERTAYYCARHTAQRKQQDGL